MPVPSKEKINNFIDTVLFKNLTNERLEQALTVLSRLPLTHEMTNRIRDTYTEVLDGEGDECVLAVVKQKEEERFLDAGAVLQEAVERNIETVADLYTWLGLDLGKNTKDAIDKMHLYKRVGPKGKPELATYMT